VNYYNGTTMYCTRGAWRRLNVQFRTWLKISSKYFSTTLCLPGLHSTHLIYFICKICSGKYSEGLQRPVKWGRGDEYVQNNLLSRALFSAQGDQPQSSTTHCHWIDSSILILPRTQTTRKWPIDHRGITAHSQVLLDRLSTELKNPMGKSDY